MMAARAAAALVQIVAVEQRPAADGVRTEAGADLNYGGRLLGELQHDLSPRRRPRRYRTPACAAVRGPRPPRSLPRLLAGRPLVPGNSGSKRRQRCAPSACCLGQAHGVPRSRSARAGPRHDRTATAGGTDHGRRAVRRAIASRARHRQDGPQHRDRPLRAQPVGPDRGGAVITAAEIYFEHDSASFGNKMMWLPVVLGPVGAAAGVAGFFSRRMAKTALAACLRDRSSPTACRGRICMRAGSRRSRAAGPMRATTWRWDRRCWRRCW